MDQLIFEIKVNLLLGDLDDLLLLLESKGEEFRWLIDSLEKQIQEQIMPLIEKEK